MADTNNKPKGRPPKFDWSDKRDLCYKLYVEDKRPIQDIIQHFQNIGLDSGRVLTPRDCSRQIVKWGFPHRHKKLTVDEQVRLVSRIKELWSVNTVQKQMLQVLEDEGWDLDEPALGRIRRKHGLVMRVANGYSTENMGPGTGSKRKRDDEVEVVEKTATPEVQLSSEEAARRAQRMLELQAHSDAALHTKKRRRRIRGLAHLPPDAPGMPPRYKSETSLDECKVYLQLSNVEYKQVRQDFEAICKNNNVVKKTECQPGDWQTAKDHLVRGNIKLSAALNPLHSDLDDRQNALECICADVTKRMRMVSKRILLKDANNILGLNPEQSKKVRHQFYEVLQADNFQTKLFCGKAHWEELRQQWIADSPEAQQLHVVAALDVQKAKCIEILLRDAMKRYNDDRGKKLPQTVRGLGPGPARRSAAASSPQADFSTVLRADDSNVDPALYALQGPANDTLPAYFRLAPESRLINHPKLWLATLQKRTVRALRKAIRSKAPSAKIRKLYGVVKGAANDDPFEIDDEDELQAYLETIAELADGKATFIVVLDPPDA